MDIRQVEITVTSSVVGSYEARSYPDSQEDATGYYPLYRVPLYSIRVTGTDDSHHTKSVDFMAPRFMPYFNDPTDPSPHYKTKGWVNAGLSSARKVTISQYKREYSVQNRFSPGRGAIVLKDTFYIHAGPASLTDVGFGSAGCIEIIGNYDNFKQTIVELSGLKTVSTDNAIQQLVNTGKLIVTIQPAVAPDIKKGFTRKIHD